MEELGQRSLTAFAVALIIAFAVLNIALGLSAWSHEMHQGKKEGQFLYGIATGHYNTTRGAKTNCCTLQELPSFAWGDCKEVTDMSRIENLGEDGLVVDGVRFDREVVNASPDGKVYVCQKSGHLPHCLFATESRM
jgi:Tfp pilus tip-associated adhesin PilY1